MHAPSFPPESLSQTSKIATLSARLQIPEELSGDLRALNCVLRGRPARAGVHARLKDLVGSSDLHGKERLTEAWNVISSRWIVRFGDKLYCLEIVERTVKHHRCMFSVSESVDIFLRILESPNHVAAATAEVVLRFLQVVLRFLQEVRIFF